MRCRVPTHLTNSPIADWCKVVVYDTPGGGQHGVVKAENAVYAILVDKDHPHNSVFAVLISLYQKLNEASDCDSL